MSLFAGLVLLAILCHIIVMGLKGLENISVEVECDKDVEE